MATIRKKTMIAIMALFLIASIMCSCTWSIYGDPVTPYGVWQSDDPQITIDFDPDTDSDRYSGTYTIDGVEHEIFVSFDMSWSFTVYDISAYVEEYIMIRGDDYFFKGDYRIKGNTMTYSLIQSSREKTGYSKIVFEKIKDYADSSTSE